MSIIGVPNLKETETWEGYFNAHNYICKEESYTCMKKMGQHLGVNISRNAEAISLNFDMSSSVYKRQKIYKFGRNQLSSFGGMEGRIWQLYVTSK